MPAATPAFVIGGYLGAGKTTLVNHLLRHAAGRRIAVLVNDFGELSIDTALIVGAQGEVLALAGGCVCCSFGADLVGGVIKALARDPAPEVVLIECSGVGLPAAVARTARLAPGLALEAIVVVADAATLRERAADTYVGDTVRQQLREADLLVVNKADLLDAPAQAALQAWLGALAPQAAQVAAVHGAVLPELVLDLQGLGQARPNASLRPATARWDSIARELAAPVDVPRLCAALVAPGSGVLRAKGFLTGHDGRRVLLQQVGARLRLEPLPATAVGTPDRLLVIGSGDLARFFVALDSPH